MRKVVPRPGSERSTNMRPEWYCSMMRLASVSPSPQPRFLVVNPGLKMVFWCLREMPLPVSVTSTTAFSPSIEVRMSIAPVPSIASTAFLIRFSMTHSTRGVDNCTCNGLLASVVVRRMLDDMRVDM